MKGKQKIMSELKKGQEDNGTKVNEKFKLIAQKNDKG